MSTLSRTIEQWRNCDPRSMALASVAAIQYALSDAKHDILVLHAQRDELLKALRNLHQCADHIGSRVYDWERLLPAYIAAAGAAIARVYEPDETHGATTTGDAA